MLKHIKKDNLLFLYVWYNLVGDNMGVEGIDISDDGTITGIFEYGNQETETLGTIDDFSPEKNNDVDTFLTYAGLLWDEYIST